MGKRAMTKSQTTCGEVEHRPSWKYRAEDEDYCEQFRGPVMKIETGGRLNRMLFWRRNDGWRVGCEQGYAVPVVELNELTLRLLLLKTPKEVMRWAQQQQ